MAWLAGVPTSRSGGSCVFSRPPQPYAVRGLEPLPMGWLSPPGAHVTYTRFQHKAFGERMQLEKASPLGQGVAFLGPVMRICTIWPLQLSRNHLRQGLINIFPQSIPALCESVLQIRLLSRVVWTFACVNWIL